MPRRVALRRVVAAADVAADQADAEVAPHGADPKTVFTAGHRLGELGDLNLIEVAARRGRFHGRFRMARGGLRSEPRRTRASPAPEREGSPSQDLELDFLPPSRPAARF